MKIFLKDLHYLINSNRYYYFIILLLEANFFISKKKWILKENFIFTSVKKFGFEDYLRLYHLKFFSTYIYSNLYIIN